MVRRPGLIEEHGKQSYCGSRGAGGWLLYAAFTALLAAGIPTGLAQAAQNSGATGAKAVDISPSAHEAPEKHPWTIDQLLPLTVAEAWQKSGRNEDRFFDMVQDLAAFSAHNRHLVLPESAAAGQQAGQYIKEQAKADHQQLLYAVVDSAVRKVGQPASAK